MARKTTGKTKRTVKAVRLEKEELDIIVSKFGSLRGMIDAVLKKIKSDK